jgi:hypothetical protein
MKTDITMKGWEELNLIRRTEKYSENSIELATHTQIFKQQKQLNVKNHHIFSILTMKVMDSALPSKDTIWQTGL